MNNQNESWMNNPKLSGMDMSKLAMLGQLAEQGKGTGASALSHVRRFPKQRKQPAVFFSGNGNYHSGPKSRKIPGRNPAHGPYASTDKNDALNHYFPLFCSKFFRIHSRSSTRAWVTACSLTLLRFPVKWHSFTLVR